jgi:hypothetical protein
MKFKQAVEKTPDVASGYKSGLSALGKYSQKMSCGNVRLLEGSVDIDTCTRTKYPNDSRWDYALSYNQKIYFVEVHPASTSEISAILDKLCWLKDWLNQHAPKINQLPKAQPAFYWIQSSNFAILKTSPQFRKIVQHNLKPISRLLLP